MYNRNVVETTLLQEIKKVLSQFDSYWDSDLLLKNKVVEDLRNYEETLITALLSNDLIKEIYTIEVGDTAVFKIEDFVNMLRYKSYWDNSYTKYTNEIGLTSEGKYLKYNTDVVLDFPHKDCVLEGGMTKEDVGKKEVYYHNVLAKEEIDRLLSPKVLTNVKKYDENGEYEVTDFKDTDNLILKGNNLIALHTLQERYAGKVKLIYIDPPYNTGNDSFRYNDRFNRSTWLTFMKNRLKVAKWLLRDDGVIYVHCDDNQQAYLKVVMDEIFLYVNFITTNCYQGMDNINNDAKFFSTNHKFILFYAQDKNSTTILGKKRTEEHNKVYKNYDNDPRGRYLLTPLHAKSGSKAGIYTYTFKNGISWTPPNGTYPRFSKETLRKLEEDNRIYFGSRENAIPQRKTFLSEVSQYVTLTTFWDYKLAGSTRNSRSEIKSLELDELFDTPKPEKLLQLIIESCTKKGDLVLDFFMGSGTTQAVAHKLERQYIGIEQMEYINTVSVPRLQKVVQGEQGGITKDVD